MLKSTWFRMAAVALVLALSITAGAAPRAEAAVYPQNKCFLGFQDYNVFGIPYFFILGDLWVVGNGRICSSFFGKCGELTITGQPTATRTTFTGSINNEQNWLLGGDWELSAGQAERRYLGGVISGVTYTLDLFYSPAERYNGTMEGFQVPCP